MPRSIRAHERSQFSRIHGMAHTPGNVRHVRSARRRLQVHAHWSRRGHRQRDAAIGMAQAGEQQFAAKARTTQRVATNGNLHGITIQHLAQQQPVQRVTEREFVAIRGEASATDALVFRGIEHLVCIRQPWLPVRETGQAHQDPRLRSGAPN